jgi:hypothetical protein
MHFTFFDRISMKWWTSVGALISWSADWKFTGPRRSHNLCTINKMLDKWINDTVNRKFNCFWSFPGWHHTMQLTNHLLQCGKRPLANSPKASGNFGWRVRSTLYSSVWRVTVVKRECEMHPFIGQVRSVCWYFI